MAFVDDKKTVIMPVIVDPITGQYIIKVTRVVWNAMQVYLIKGAEQENQTLEIHYEKPTAPQP